MRNWSGSILSRLERSGNRIEGCGERADLK
jgi:hypothetical protein